MRRGRDEISKGYKKLSLRAPYNGAYSGLHRDMGSLYFALPTWAVRRWARERESAAALALTSTE